MTEPKPRLVEVTGAELSEISAGGNCLSVPALFSQRIGSRIHFFANAEDLRDWRYAHNFRRELLMETPSMNGVRACHKWLSYCLSIGWPPETLKGLADLFWRYHDLDCHYHEAAPSTFAKF